MAFRADFYPPTLAYVAVTFALACGPKLDSDEGGDVSSGGSTTTGEPVTTGASDPSSPGSSPSPTQSSGGDPGFTTASTAASTTGVVTGEDPTATVATGDTSEPPPVEPPMPCTGEAVALEGPRTAYRQAQLPPNPNPGTGGSSGGGEPDPATLYVRLSDQEMSCGDPTAALQCGGHWEVTIAIPPEFQAPGLFNLLGPDVHGSASETGPDNGNNNECSFGGGSFPATLEIVTIDDLKIEGRLCHVESLLSVDVDLERSFTAFICP